jgi:hypothetical protein
MPTNIVEIDQVKPDVDELAMGTIKNPLEEEFMHEYAGRKIFVPAGKKQKALRFVEKEVKDEKTGKMTTKKVREEYDKIIPGEKEIQLPVAVHIAHHLAQKIIRAKHKEFLDSITEKEEYRIECAKPIPDYKGKVWEKMKELVETDSDFFDDDREGGSNKEKL